MFIHVPPCSMCSMALLALMFIHVPPGSNVLPIPPYLVTDASLLEYVIYLPDGGIAPLIKRGIVLHLLAYSSGDILFPAKMFPSNEILLE